METSFIFVLVILIVFAGMLVELLIEISLVVLF